MRACFVLRSVALIKAQRCKSGMVAQAVLRLCFFNGPISSLFVFGFWCHVIPFCLRTAYNVEHGCLVGLTTTENLTVIVLTRRRYRTNSRYAHSLKCLRDLLDSTVAEVISSAVSHQDGHFCGTQQP